MHARRMLMLVILAFVLLALDSFQAAAQTCRWDGTSPFCDGECGDNESEIARLSAIPPHWTPPFVIQNPPFGADCLTGAKALCCQTSGRTCRWDGTAPFCAGECDKEAGEVPAEPPPGSSGGAACWTGSKVYCCRVRTGTVLLPDTPAPEPDPTTPPPDAPTGCRENGANCGVLSVQCQAPLPVADQIVVRDLSSNLGITVTRAVGDLGLVDARYFREGDARVQVCARNRGGTRCGNEVTVLLGPTFCLPPPPQVRPCPPDETPCPGHGGRCLPLGECNLIK
jgi:hypothetical protein